MGERRSQEHCCKQRGGSPGRERRCGPGQGCPPQPQQPPQMHYVLPPTTGTFPNTLRQTQHAAEGEQSLPAAKSAQIQNTCHSQRAQGQAEARRFCTAYPEQPDGTVFMRSDPSLMAGQGGRGASWVLTQEECSMRNKLGALCEGLRGNKNDFCGSNGPRRCLGKHWEHSASHLLPVKRCLAIYV